MENKEIMEKLLDNNHSTVTAKVQSDSKKKDEASLSRIRVITAKYKVYLVLLLIFICILVLELIPNMKDNYNSTKSSYDQVQSQLNVVEWKIEEAKKEEKYLYEIVENEDTLKDCLNGQNDESCQNLPDSWKKVTDEWEEYDYVVPFSFLQTHSLHSVKMSVDEKKVLKNLDYYLIKEDISWDAKDRVWDILRITIWDPSPVNWWDQHFFVVPVNVSIKFAEVEDLIWFLYNVEKKMVKDPEDRILYKIQTVSYDIISSDEDQITEIEMLAYYYYDEKFENMEDIDLELSENEQPVEETQEVQDVNQSEWSFLDKIFKR